jgi:YjbE family integral membrane protein
MNEDIGSLLLQLVEIAWINILLSGDNAVVIALACRSLPVDKRRWGILLGAGAAVLLRVFFTAIVVTLLDLPWLKLVGGVLLLWISIKLVVDEQDEHSVKASSTVWGAVSTIAVADAVMSLDNVIAIAAAARGNFVLIVFGLLLSVPLIIFGATLVMTALEKLPWLAWAGAALLGYVAGGLIATDPAVEPHLHSIGAHAEQIAGIAGTIFVLLVAAAVHWWRSRGVIVEGD